MSIKSNMSSEAYDLLDNLCGEVRDIIRDLVEEAAKNRNSFVNDTDYTLCIEVEDVKSVGVDVLKAIAEMEKDYDY